MRERRADRVRVEAREHQPCQSVPAHPGEPLVAGDEFLVRQFGGDGERGLGGALADAGLQHPQRAAFDGELDVAQIAVVGFQQAHVVAQLDEGLGVRMVECVQPDSVADAGDHVLALRVGQVVAVQTPAAGGRVAGEGDATAGVLAEVAEDHPLHVDGRAEVVADALATAIEPGAFTVPGLEDGPDRPLQLRCRALREVVAGLLVDQVLVRLDERSQVVRVQLKVVGRSPCLPEPGHDALEPFALQAHHGAAEHLDEAAVGVPGEALVPGDLGETQDGLVVQADVEDRLHHARHGEAGSGPDGEQQRIVRLPESPPGGPLQDAQVLRDLTGQTLGLGAVGQEGSARRGGDGEPRRYGQPEPGHLGQVGPLATEQVGHVPAALGEVVHVVRHGGVPFLPRAGPEPGHISKTMRALTWPGERRRLRPGAGPRGSPGRGRRRAARTPRRGSDVRRRSSPWCFHGVPEASGLLRLKVRTGPRVAGRSRTSSTGGPVGPPSPQPLAAHRWSRHAAGGQSGPIGPGPSAR